MVAEKRISLAMRCLTALIKNSEKEGTYGLISHRAFAEGGDVPEINILNEFNYEANTGFQKTFKLNLKQNMSMLMVKKLICQQLAFKLVG